MRLARLAPCVRSTSKAVTGCAKARRWTEAIALLHAVFDVDIFGINGMMRACGARWSVALRGLSMAAGVRLQPDVCSFSTLLSTAEQESAWRAAQAINCHFESLAVPDTAFNLLISSASKAKKWRASLGFFQNLLPKTLRPDEISLSVATRPQTWSRALSLLNGVRSNLRPDSFAVAARSPAWPWPLHCFQHMRSQSLSTRSLPLQTSCVEFCRNWQLVLSITLQVADADVRFFSAAMSSCVACERPDVALFLLWAEANRMNSMKTLRHFRSPVDYLWALARLEVRDPEIIHEAFRQALAQTSQPSPKQVSALWWSGAVLGVSGGTGSLFRHTMKILQTCSERELMLVSWGMAVDPHGIPGLLRCQEEMALRIQMERMSPDLIQSVLGVMWSSAYRNACSFRFHRNACRALEQYGQALDQAVTASEDLQVARDASDAEAKRMFESPDVAVLYKPSGWEVYNTGARDVKGSLLSFLQSTRSSALLVDASVSFGFLHRLDVPSSGLIIAAKTYRTFYSLKAQLSSGRIERSYVALCHSLAETRFIVARVSWTAEASAGLTSAGFGKYAKTFVEASSWTKASRATSLLNIQICTGRRHQIRSHCSHVGHPIICDARYTSEMTFQEDCAWCPRNFLHRNRLVFHLASSGHMDIQSELPSDLSVCLESLQSKGKQCKTMLFEKQMKNWIIELIHKNIYWQRYCKVLAISVA